MKVLFYEWDAFMQRDMEDVLKRIGIEYDAFWYPFLPKLTDDDPYFERNFGRIMAEGNYDIVFSFNFKSVVAKCAKNAGIPYIAWVFDSPFGLSEDKEILSYRTNYIFVFDRYVYRQLIERGIKTVYHMPLAVNTERLDRIKLSSDDRARYGADISFVGTLYSSTFGGFQNKLSPYESGMVQSVIDAQMRIYGAYCLDRFTEGDMCQRLYQTLEGKDDSYDTIFHESLQSLLAKEITRRERLMLLFLLSQEHHVALFSNNNEEMLSQVDNRGVIDSYTEVYKVYKSSKINLNISFKRIVEGMPLRVFDIMGAGGFLLSNYQPELVENFVPGEECEVYTSIEDAVDKARYYLSHDEEREAIAKNGYNKVKQYSFENQLEKMFAIVRDSR